MDERRIPKGCRCGAESETKKTEREDRFRGSARVVGFTLREWREIVSGAVVFRKARAEYIKNLKLNSECSRYLSHCLKENEVRAANKSGIMPFPFLPGSRSDQLVVMGQLWSSVKK